MPLASSLESQFLEHLPAIDRIAAALCRRRGVTGEDVEDFIGHVRARFVESGYAPIGKFRGEAAIGTYLTVVVASWFKDYMVAREGRWRPSAAALRAGPVAVLLERLMYKSGASRDEAVARVLGSDENPYSEEELRRLASVLPVRTPLRPRAVSSDAAVEVAIEAAVADTTVVREELDLEVARAQRALHESLSALSAEDRTIVTMRYLDDCTVAEIARALRLEQKPLYRRLERAMLTLRERLRGMGVTQETVREISAGRD